jgi:23S rRNA (uracil1939-C5)-methyltransferase
MKLRIEKPIYGGAGLARDQGKAVFVPFALPGEEVEIDLKQSKSSYAEASLVRVIEPSPERVLPPCPYFGACGGCHYQHASYDEQLRWKNAILRESLTRAGLNDLPEIEAISAEPYGYRNRIRLHVRQRPFALGYMREHSHDLLPVTECPIAAPALVHQMRLLEQQGAGLLAGWAKEVELFADAQGEQLLLSVFAAHGSPQLQRRVAALWDTVRRAAPEVRGIAAYELPRDKGFPKRAATAGEDFLLYGAAGQQYRVSAGAFFQVNRFLIDRMVAEVAAERTGALAWDLYAGVGLFAKQLQAQFDRVVAVEAAPDSSADLKINLGRSATVVRANTLAFLQQAAQRPQERPELIVVDPPRAGLGKEVTSLLGQVHAPHITYVSCDPATLSRDIKALLESGYRLHRLQLLDLFPQTFHLETIARLTLG